MLGIERYDEIKKLLKGRSVSIVCNLASLDRSFIHTLDILKNLDVEIKSIMAPQHGFTIDRQANMEESDHTKHPEYKIPIYSLYGKTREPEDYMLENVDTVVFDLQDVGARYYTFIYTMANTMKVCAKRNKRFVILDRPNPINGVTVEGGIVHEGFESFVGMYPISNRHGMTVAELALLFNSEFNIGCDLETVKLEGWKRENYWDDLSIDWIMPTPNIPSPNTALVYAGQCLLEGTNVSEGRGTTKPFEIFGAPFINHRDFLNHSAIKNLNGLFFRPMYFKPAFDKFDGEICRGFQIHITNRKEFNSLKTSLGVIYALHDLCDEFSFKPPGYEYEYEKMPIDILIGSDKPRLSLKEGCSFKEFCGIVDLGKNSFIEMRRKYLLYS